ncbi:MAG: hypothetical protein JJ920_17665 [Roseitalea sp.]|jgi:hypothetical protein|nr:hypothetical protein [Roseitalea sp.]MBO6723472.1 hypothetical protein [Roseitalea sp.]MBO6744745.1 hypothetical protein [Roseitalea sp.]
MSHTVLRSSASLALVCAGSLALAGCFGPTYGTGVTATDQLFDDLGNAISLGDRTPPPQINYTPRPDIVRPTETSSLPAPQESIATASGQWPESPEERRERVRREADDGLRDPNFIANRRDAEALGASEGPDRVQASATRRVYLTDPPTEYRQPAETAAYGDLGPTESQKARAAKRAQGEKTGWRRWLPF